MDGTKLVTDTKDIEICGRQAFCQDRSYSVKNGGPGRNENPVVVGSEQSENLCHRKGKGSLTIQISQGLVNPNPTHNSQLGKGKQVNIPVLSVYAWQHKPDF